jgi:hypothetical protein
MYSTTTKGVQTMLSLLEFLLVLAVVISVGVQLVATIWKLKLAIKKVARKVSDNVIVAFLIKIGMFLYFGLVATVDRSIN